jgi:hypothetical protein
MAYLSTIRSTARKQNSWEGRAYFEYAIRAEAVKHLRVGRAAFQLQTSGD